MVVEIPRFSNAKNEVNKKSPLNPIVQDSKNGKPRFVADIFPFKGYIWNYGSLPQTYEDPEVIDKSTGYFGDGDPIDVLEIGSRVATVGEIKQVKVLGVMGLIDDGETDWKVLAIDVKDPISERLNTTSDLDSVMPGLINATRDWLTNYKIPDGKAQNKWAFEGSLKDSKFTMDIIKEAHMHWLKLTKAQNNPDHQAKFGMFQNSSDKSEFTKRLESQSSQSMSQDTSNISKSEKWFFLSNGKISN
ncbi:Inorganic pyrophosphatase [Smittium culicis]|uniref:inorganic diphosphatase n=1 Tax=Smittium culicis TaxID=133412 RepID=A0A1R1YQQ0_9FUNG|nr:Inorganic pyrophosphatase [Smittium culicis]